MSCELALLGGPACNSSRIAAAKSFLTRFLRSVPRVTSITYCEYARCTGSRSSRMT